MVPAPRNVETQSVEDDSLAQRAHEDNDAFAELYQRHLCSVFNYVRSQVPDDATAEDLTAQVFFKALRSAETYRGSGTYSSWLYQIARNCIASWHRSRGKVIVLDALPEPPDLEPSAAVRVIDEESRRHVWETVSRLPVRQREAVVLRYMNELSIDEIAHITKRSPGAVRTLLHRARKRLRKGYERKVG